MNHAMVGQPGSIKHWIQIAKTPGSVANNPAMLSGAAGVMSQVAMQQTMAEITAYLERIDQKLDGVLRAQTNQVLSRVDGVDLAIQEAVSVRNSVGRVSDVTWSKVQNSTSTILETQAYSMRQLKDLADNLERKSKVGDLADTAKEAETEVEKWLAVLARCFQLHDAIAVLELDRVLDSSPDELDHHRLGLKAARQDRMELIAQSTELLLERMNSAVGTANSRVLMHPIASPSVVQSRNCVASHVHDFHETLGVESGRETSESRRWLDAAAERWEVVRDTSAEGLGTVKQFGNETFGQARSVGSKVSGRIAERVQRRGDTEDLPEDSA